MPRCSTPQYSPSKLSTRETGPDQVGAHFTRGFQICQSSFPWLLKGQGRGSTPHLSSWSHFPPLPNIDFVIHRDFCWKVCVNGLRLRIGRYLVNNGRPSATTHALKMGWNIALWIFFATPSLKPLLGWLCTGVHAGAGPTLGDGFRPTTKCWANFVFRLWTWRALARVCVYPAMNFRLQWMNRSLLAAVVWCKLVELCAR